MFYNGYWATRALLEAIERAQTTNNYAIIKELEQLKIPASVRMQTHDAWMNAKTHQLQQSIYLATANLRSRPILTVFTRSSPRRRPTRSSTKTPRRSAARAAESTPLYKP